MGKSGPAEVKIVSACFAGVNCRYDKKHNKIDKIRKLVREGKAIPVCPEQMGDFQLPAIRRRLLAGMVTMCWTARRK